METEPFEIDLYIFHHYYKISKEIKDAIHIFLVGERKFHGVVDLFEKLVDHQVVNPNTLTNKNWRAPNRFLTANDQKEMYRSIKTSFELVDNPEGYSHANRMVEYYSPGHEEDVFRSTVLVILNEPFPLTYENFNHRLLFRKLFAEMVSQTNYPKEFIEYHFKKSFSNLATEYNQFLTLIVRDGNIQENTEPFLKLWINDELPSKSTEINRHTGEVDREEKQNLTVRQLALMHHYLQETGEEPLFESPGSTKKEAIKKVAEKYQVSANTFTQKYNEVHTKRDQRVKNIADLKTVSEFLPEGKAKNMIIDEIKTCESN